VTAVIPAIPATAVIPATAPAGVTKTFADLVEGLRGLASHVPGLAQFASAPYLFRPLLMIVLLGAVCAVVGTLVNLRATEFTAEAMVRSVNTHVHVTEWLTCDVTGTMELVETLKGRREFAGQRVSPLLVYAKAVCLALGRNPGLNASWDGQAGEIIHHGDVNLGIATATPRGLMVPNIKAAQGLSLLELCQAIGHLVAVSREGRLQPPDYAGGTFTITNVGVFGVDAGTPIINGDESAILCMGAIQRRPWVVGTGAEERVVPRWVTTLALSFDHRIIDGEEASRFLRDVAEILADPALALLF